MKTIKLTLKKSMIGKPEKLRKVVRALGLRHIRQSVIHNDTPSIRGMIHRTSHLIEVSEAAEE